MRNEKNLASFFLGVLVTLCIILILTVSVVACNDYFNNKKAAKTECYKLGYNSVNMKGLYNYECESISIVHDGQKTYKAINTLAIVRWNVNEDSK